MADLEEDMSDGGFVDDDEDMDDGTNQEGEKLECDLSAYTLFHEGSTGAPCLSFDILRDGCGADRTCDNPVTCYFVAGTQAERTHVNNIILMKMTNLKKVKQSDQESDEEDEDDEDSDDEDDDPNPHIFTSMMKHDGCVNRIRAANFNNLHFAASWSELGVVNIWELSRMLEAVENQGQGGQGGRQEALDDKPLYTYKGHRTEGYAMDWARTMPGTLATGDCEKHIYVWKPTGSGTWEVGSQPYEGHTASVEDIQWSPNEPHVFASCSVDKSIRIWDCRAKPSKACMITAANTHESDVNVIHWNANEPFIVSGGDDGKVQVWDLRQMQQNAGAVAVLKYHEAPVTTVEWHPVDASVLASGGEDHQILQWDLAVERDQEQNQDDDDPNIPQQLLFVHKGQQEVKELHWHPQVKGLVISTALSGFNIFKTISC